MKERERDGKEKKERWKRKEGGRRKEEGEWTRILTFQYDILLSFKIGRAHV